MIPTLVQNDPWLTPYLQEILNRNQRLEDRLKNIETQHGSLEKFASAYEYFGLHFIQEKNIWIHREWAPAAKQLFLIGDFNQWNRNRHPFYKKDNGIWEIEIPASEFEIKHLTAYKIYVVSSKGGEDRMPAYVFYATQDEKTNDFTGRVWNPPHLHIWTDKSFKSISQFNQPLIYECHIGMAQEKEGLGTYREFADINLPYIAHLGYNTIQVMAIPEHPYYGSFGYHVSNFFAPSSRFGTPDDLKYLINKAHEMGIAVIMDLVHSHAVKNFAEGLNDLDGSDHQYFHEGGKGYHSGWDSKLFNYGKTEVLQFLLSNVKYWIEEFHIDGYRYDGVTSMLYFHHGDYVSFDHYDRYFQDVDWDVITYLQLANTLIKSIKKDAIVIAEDMSGMPGMCRPVNEGGLGFDFRLGMGIPDFWIKLLKHKSDENWDIHEIWHTLTNRRSGERTLAYTESHDQALVGDKTLAFWLMDQEMYWHMQVNDEHVVIDRGIALHKMIRLITLSLGGEGYLNFIGNEFGHPEWVDFPREGNNWSYKYARRQWSLVNNDELKYKYLKDFDQAMISFVSKNMLLTASFAQQINMDSQNHVIIFERNNLLFAFNFHWINSIPDYRFKVPHSGKYKIILNTDKKEYGGHERIDDRMTYPAVTLFGEHFLSIYLPARTAVVIQYLG